MAITLEQAKALKYGQTLTHDTLKNADGKSPMVFRVAGAVKTWKRDKGRIRVPLKRGLYQTGYLVNGEWEGGRCFDLDISEVSID
jgi:hypothetical protein